MADKYEILNVETFGRRMILTGDLDPVYIALNNMDMPRPQLEKFMVAYWCYYHVGFACYASERQGAMRFWDTMRIAAWNTTPAPTGGRWPRGSERRHFRGSQGVKATEDLIGRYQEDPGAIVRYIAGSGEGPVPVADIFKRTQEHRGFGDWISFKVADLMDRVLGVPVSFTNGHIFMFTDPVKGAKAADAAWGTMFFENHSDPEACDLVVNRLIAEFSDLKAPPTGNRPINVQEVETVLCKWKGHIRGRHPVGHDGAEIRDGLYPWMEFSATARDFYRALPALEGTQV